MPTVEEVEAGMRERLSQRARASTLTVEGPPDEAAKTLKNSVQQGVPFAVGHDDPDFNREAEAQQDNDVISGNPSIQKYLADNDFAAQVSQGDYAALSKATGFLRRWAHGEMDVYKAAWEGVKAGWGEEPLGEGVQRALGEMGAPGARIPASERALDATLRFPAAIITGGAAAVGEAYKQLGGNEAFAKRLTRDVVALGNMYLAAIGQVPHIPPELNTLARDASVYRSAGETPKPGVNYVLDKVNVAQAKVDAQNYQETMKAIGETETAKRSPEATKAFINSVAPGKEISVPAEAIQEKALQGMFDKFPEFQKDYERALAGGGDVSFMLDDWGTLVPDEVRDALKDDVRIRTGGLTPREAEGVEATTPEQYQDELHVSNEQLTAESDRLKDEIASIEKTPENEDAIAELKARKSLIDRQIVKPKTAARQVAERELWLKPLFNDQTFKRFMPIGDFVRYSKRLETEANEANAAELARAEREAKKRQTAEWKANRENLREEVKADYEDQPLIQADRFLRDGTYFGQKIKYKLSRGDIPAKYNQLFKYAADQGIHPDDMATLFGYGSGKKMLDDLLTLDQRRGETAPGAYMRSLIDTETDRRMEVNYGVLKDNILREAREVVGTGGQADLLADEMFALRNSLGELPKKFNREFIEGRIRDFFNSSSALKAKSVETFVRDVGKAGRQAETALLKGDVQAAFQAKQKQFIAFQFMREAQKFEKQVERTEDYIKRFRSQIVESVDQRYTDQVHNILADMGLGERFPVPPGTPSLEAFVRNSEDQVQVAYWLRELGPKPKYENLTVDQYRAFSDSLKSLIEVGRNEKKVLTAEGKADLDTAAKEIKESLGRFGKVNQGDLNPTLPQRIGNFVRQIQAKLLLAERVMDYSDKNDPNGPMKKYIDQPLRNASTKEMILREQVVKRLKALEKFTDTSVNDLIDNNLFPSITSRTGFLNMSRHNLRMVMLYMGDEVRAEKLVRGYGLLRSDAEEFYGASHQEVLQDAYDRVKELIDNHATEKDWNWVQGMWDIFDHLKPEADAMHIRDTGVPVDETPRRPMRAFNREFTGGYTPLVYDKTQTQVLPQSLQELFQPNYFFATTPKSYTRPITMYAEPLDLSGVLMSTRLQGMVHDIAFREAIRSVNKILNHPDFRIPMTQAWGKEIQEMFPKWLRDIANVQNVDDSYAQGWARAAAFFRQNMVSGLTFVNPRTIIKHGLTAMSLSSTQGGFVPLVKASADLWVKEMRNSIKGLRNAPEMVPPSEDFVSALREVTAEGEKGDSTMDFILENSPMMRNRQLRFQDSIREAYERASEAGKLRTYYNFRHAAMNFGRAPIAWSDAFSAFPTWLMNYKKGFAEGMPHAEAVLFADKAVTRAHGSTMLMDKPSALRTRDELYRWFTPLYNFWNHAFNFQMQLGWDISAWAKGAEEPGANIPSLLMRAFKTVAVPMVVEELANLSFTDDHKSWGMRSLEAMVRFFGGGIPGFREVTNAAASGREPSVGLLTTAGQTATATVRDVRSLVLNKNVSKDWITHSAATTGMVLGIGGAPVGRLTTFTVGYLNGKERPMTFEEWSRGLMSGHVKPPRRH